MSRPLDPQPVDRSLDALPVAGTVVLMRADADGFAVLLMRRPDRGSFAGGWVFPGGKVEAGDRRPGDAVVDAARRAAVREAREEVGLHVDGLVPLSEWQPPLEVPTRIRTWFFLAMAPDQQAVPSDAEVAELAWVTPAEALARHGAGEWTLFPPTWVTLHRLSMFPHAEAALASAGSAEVFRTRILGAGSGDHATASGPSFGWEQGRLDTGVLPWRFVAS